MIAHRYLYLHGWASSPNSSKARYFQQQFQQLNIELLIPDLNQNDFYHLTLSRQIAQATALLPPEQPTTIIGSSLGGLTALWLAEQLPQVERLVLFAPALRFLARCQGLIGAENMQRWQQSGELPMYHYADERERRLSYDFIRDFAQYPDAGLQRKLPTLILHGRKDEVIGIDTSRQFAKQHPWVKLQELNSDHGLNDVQDRLWTTTRKFCQLV